MRGKPCYFSFMYSRILALFEILLFPHWIHNLVHLLLLVNAVFAGTAVYEEEKTADDREDLEEIVLGEILVWVVLVKLENVSR